MLPKQERNSLSEGAITFVVDTLFSQCDVCDAEITLPEQLKQNRKNAVGAKNRAIGMPSAEDLIAWRRRHGLSQEAAGKLTGLGKAAFCKYETLTISPSAPTVRLLKILLECDEAVAILAREWDVHIATKMIGDQRWTEEAKTLFFQETPAVNEMSHAQYFPVRTKIKRSLGSVVNSLIPEQWVASVCLN